MSFLQRCLDRLKQSREKLITRFRQVDVDSEATTSSAASPPQNADSTVSVQEVMEQEWERMRSEDSTLPQLTPSRRRGIRKRGARDPVRPEPVKRLQADNPVFSSDEEYEVR